MKAVTQVREFVHVGFYVMTHERLAPNFMSRTRYCDPAGVMWSHVDGHPYSREDAIARAQAYAAETGHPVLVYAPADLPCTRYEVEDVA